MVSVQEVDMSRRKVVVIVPVYRDIAMTVECIESAMPGVLDIPDTCLLAINDDSPELGMSAALEELEQRWTPFLIVDTNERNLGFVETVNRGMRRFTDRDVVLLNSDVVLPTKWLLRLREDAYSRRDVASVTPLSNNTTICTFPDFLQDNDLPYGLNTEQVDRAFSDFLLPCVEAPTGIGFCMYIRRQALIKVGYFNSDEFPRGYGEENDFCQRAIKSGFVNLITPNLYVFHQGGVSFADEKAALIENATKVIDRLHPNYHSDVQRFIAADPLRRARVLRLVRLLSDLERPKILHISHGMGGGIQQHIEELISFHEKDAVGLWLYPNGRDGTLSLRFGAQKAADSILFKLPVDWERLTEILTVLNISLLHYHHAMNLDAGLLKLGTLLSRPHILTVHDFYLLNGNPTLTDESGVFYGEYSDELTNSLYPLPDGVSPSQWRDMHRALVESASAVIFPSHSTRSIFGTHYDLRHSVVAPHPELGRDVNAPIKPWRRKDRYIIAVAGAVNKEKGALLLSEMATIAAKQAKPLDFVLIGYAHSPLPNVVITGPYEAERLNQLIHDHDVDILFIPSRCPETYNYVLSYALGTGLPIFAPRVGAFPERLAGREATVLFNHMASATAVLRELEVFIEKMEIGLPPLCDYAITAPYTMDFYEKEYLTYSDPAPPVRYGVERYQFEIGEPSRKSLSAREKVLVYLWRIYSHPAMAWVDRAIPYVIRRAVKRMLTRRSLHDIV